VERVAVDSPKAEAVIHVLWPTDDMFNIVRTRRLEVVAACLNERLQKMFPERFGTNCTVTAWSSASDTVRGAGHIHVTASVAPKQADQALALIRSEAAALGENGIADELFNRVKTPLLKSLREKKRSNDWWQTMLPYASWQPFRIFWIQAFEKDYESTTAVEAGALAKQFLVDANVCAVVGSSSGKDIFTHRPGSALQCRQACAGQKNRTQP
jgi:zinc protease